MKVIPLSEAERTYLEDVLKRWKRGMAPLAQALGISRATLYRKLDEHKLETPFVRKQREEEHDQDIRIY